MASGNAAICGTIPPGRGATCVMPGGFGLVLRALRGLVSDVIIWGKEDRVTGATVNIPFFSLFVANSDESSIHFGGDTILEKSNSATHSATRKALASEKELDVDLESEQAKIADEDINAKKKQNFKGWYLYWLALQSTGVIYGDIGTSPLYVYSSTFTSQPSYDDMIGALSIIIWTLTLLVTIKYMFIVLRADDDGEGGTFALCTLLARYANITKRDPTVSGIIKLDRRLTGDTKPAEKSLRSFLEHSMIAKTAIKVIGVLGVAMVMADGVLTPAQSILGAIQGILITNPNTTTATIAGVSCTILVLLFLVQPLGLTRIASTFAPIVIVWLLFNFISGVYNLVMYDYSVLKAFSPYFAGQYFVRNGTQGWQSLGGLLLAFTGVEALFADLGAFSQRAIQISWLGLAFPCLLFAYIGQVAFIVADQTGNAYTQPFFYTTPPGTFYFSFVLSILATTFASQAMITGTFQLLMQIINMSYFPHVKIVHISKTFHGQIYIPMANWLLMIGTVILTGVYSSTTTIGNLYGVCVIFVAFITTLMLTLIASVVWQWNIFIALFGFLVFGCLDGLYLTSALRKVPQGAWVTLMIAGVLSVIFLLWRYGKETQWAAEAEDRYPASHFLNVRDGKTYLTERFGGAEVATVNGLGILFDKVGHMTPIVFQQFVLPSIPEPERYVLSRTSIPSCYRLAVRYGYADTVITPDLGRLVVEQITLFITRDKSATVEENLGANPSSKRHSPEIQAELDLLEKAYAAQTICIMGKEEMKVREGSNIFRKIVLEIFLFIRENTRTKMASLDIPADQLVEVGFSKTI